ncbi:predicted protein [Cyanophage PSS2]|uniref:hypothetical protein n=1 Tax=Cyanophage PSS2 TaxID=658401 RepID=UPI0001B0400A|nr:hypothetical protein PSS2_gp053 [Cyanophage PSS2]ACT65615.1 hypothetical protein [Cyanophage PSS2]ACY75757.1 predicted protein [Cyanophage PSS2]
MEDGIISWQDQWTNIKLRWAIHKREWSSAVDDTYKLGQLARVQYERFKPDWKALRSTLSSGRLLP